MHCVDLGESFPTSIYLQKSASIQPRTSPSKFGGKFNSIFNRVLSSDLGRRGSSGARRHWVKPTMSVVSVTNGAEERRDSTESIKLTTKGDRFTLSQHDPGEETFTLKKRERFTVAKGNNNDDLGADGWKQVQDCTQAGCRLC